MHYAVKEHMAAPRRCDMQQAMMLGRSCEGDPSTYERPLQLGVFSD